MSVHKPDDMTTWSDGSLLGLVDILRGRLARETQEDVRAMLAYQLDDYLAEIRRRNEARAKAIAESKLPWELVGDGRE